MLTGFGSAELFEPDLPEVARELVAGVIADRAALLAIADAVLSRTTAERARAASRLRDGLRGMAPGDLAERMAAELFELAAARPVRFESDDEQRDPAGRMVAISDSPPQLESEPVARGIAARLLESGPGSIARDALRERWASWSVRRRRGVLAAAAAAVALMLASAVVPGSKAPPVTAVSSPTPVSEAAEEEPSPDPAIGGEDPLAALPELAARREGCFRELSVLCLDVVDEAGSSAWDADRVALQAILDGGTTPQRLQFPSATLIERIGDSALIDLGPDSDPASVLLLKGEAGWRIRDYLGRSGVGEPESDEPATG
jgi:hypothetical protein